MSTSTTDPATRGLTTRRKDGWRPIFGWIMATAVVFGMLLGAGPMFAHDSAARAHELSTRLQVTGVLQATPTPYGRYDDAVAPVKVTLPGGSTRVLRTDVSLYASRGDTTKLWITATGQPVDAPRSVKYCWADTVAVGFAGAFGGLLLSLVGCVVATCVTGRRAGS